MQDFQESALPSVMSVKRTTFSPDGFGGQTEGGTFFFNIPCRIRSLRGEEEVFLGVQVEAGMCVVTFPVSQPLEGKDRVTVGLVEYEVIHVEDPHAWKTAGRALVRRVTP